MLLATLADLPAPSDSQAVDLRELQSELEAVGIEYLAARRAGLSLGRAVHDPSYPALRRFHASLRDALFVELPEDLRQWAARLTSGQSSEAGAVQRFFGGLFDAAASPLIAEASADGEITKPHASERAINPQLLQAAVAELLVFEAVRLNLTVTAWSSRDYETLGGDADDIDEIAAREVDALLHEPAMREPGIRPLALLQASAAVALAADARDRADELRSAGEDLRARLRMQARVREALLTLRLPEAVLLENALANLLGSERQELVDLQSDRPLALGALSRQAMDQRVSRGRKALQAGPQAWPARRAPALFDLLAPQPA